MIVFYKLKKMDFCYSKTETRFYRWVFTHCMPRQTYFQREIGEKMYYSKDEIVVVFFSL